MPRHTMFKGSILVFMLLLLPALACAQDALRLIYSGGLRGTIEACKG